jgi:hypothetical protein
MKEYMIKPEHKAKTYPLDLEKVPVRTRKEWNSFSEDPFEVKKTCKHPKERKNDK